MFRNLVNAFKNKEIRTKILITIALLFIYRLGCWLPIPGIGTGQLISGEDSLLSLLSQIGGNALQNGAILALGITPYINASIIVQLLTVAIPALERWSQENKQRNQRLDPFAFDRTGCGHRGQLGSGGRRHHCHSFP